MNCIKRHLNWALIIGATIIELPVILSVWLINPNTSPDTSWLLGLLLPVVIAELTLEIWYLYQKKRSFAYLLLNFIKPFYIPIGFILLLCLGNKRTSAPLPEDKVIL